MVTFSTIWAAVVPVFLIAGAGYFMRRLNWLSEEADQSLLRVTINVLTPCLFFDKILQNEALRSFDNVILPPLVGFTTVALGLIAGKAVGRAIGLSTRAEIGTFALCVGLYNYGYVPTPLAELLFDRRTTGVLFVHNLGVDIALWTVGIVLLKPGSGSGWKRICNPPVIAIVAAILANLSGVQLSALPWLATAIRMLGSCAIPLGLILIGATVADQVIPQINKASSKVILAGCLLRLLALPIIFLIAARFLPLSVELKRVMLLQAAMPSAVFPIVMARHYDGDVGVALRVAVATSLLGFFTIPLWIDFGMTFLGLD